MSTWKKCKFFLSLVLFKLLFRRYPILYLICSQEENANGGSTLNTEGLIQLTAITGLSLGIRIIFFSAPVFVVLQLLLLLLLCLILTVFSRYNNFRINNRPTQRTPDPFLVGRSPKLADMSSAISPMHRMRAHCSVKYASLARVSPTDRMTLARDRI